MQGLRDYLTSRTALQDWDTQRAGQDDTVPYVTRARAVLMTTLYGVLINPTFWAGAACFATIMMGASGYGLFYNLCYYILATLISYIWADMLPLKYFSSDDGGTMDVPKAAYTNAVRMFAPLLGAGLAAGKFAPGYTLFATVAVAAVEAGKHALFHAKDGKVLADWTMLTDTLERRLAVTGLSVPPNITVIEGFLQRDQRMDVDTASVMPATPFGVTPTPI